MSGHVWRLSVVFHFAFVGVTRAARALTRLPRELHSLEIMAAWAAPAVLVGSGSWDDAPRYLADRGRVPPTVIDAGALNDAGAIGEPFRQRARLLAARGPPAHGKTDRR